MYRLLQKILFSLDSERAHETALKSLRLAHRLKLDALMPTAPALPRRLMGMDLPNPVGLAAGLDKNGAFIDALAALGFGFIEVGTVTPKAQPGNPRPRLFRLPDRSAIINRMGFNNLGIDRLIANVRRTRYRGVLGINIGKNAVTPIERAVDDYLVCLEKAYPYASYVTVNISSPNTKNLRSLQHADELRKLLGSLKTRREQLANEQSRLVPLAVKIAPDLSDEQITAIAEVVRELALDGVIVGNTTVDKSVLGDIPEAREEGGLSGKPLKARADDVLRRFAARLNPPGAEPIDIIGVGGICSGNDARDKIAAGATAVQLYSGLIYRGPVLVHESIAAMSEHKAAKRL